MSRSRRLDLKPRREAQLLPSSHAPHPPHTLLIPVSPLSPVVSQTMISCLDSAASSLVCLLPPWPCSLSPAEELGCSMLHQWLLHHPSSVSLSHSENKQSLGVFLSLLSQSQRVSVTLRGTGHSSFCPPVLRSTCCHFHVDYPDHTSLFFPPKHHLFFKFFESVSCSVVSDSLQPHGL